MYATAPKLVARGLSKRFGDFEALRGVDITVFPGRVSAFVGPNGAGKTTLFHVLGGGLAPDAGRVLLDGRDITGLPPWYIARLRVGRLFQDVRVFEHLSALDNIRAALLPPNGQGLRSMLSAFGNQKKHATKNDEALYWLEYVGLAEHAGTPGGELSFGQQKLLAIGRLAALQATLLFLDEPTAALSPAMTQKMVALIHRLVAEKNLSVALIEHNMRVVKELAFYTYFMHEGEVYCHGTQRCVLENPEVRDLYMGLSGAGPITKKTGGP